MTPTDSTSPAGRDRSLRRTGRLRRALVGGAVAASLALAGVVGVTAEQSTAATGSTTSNTGSTQPGSTSTTLSTGSGTAHATSSGS